MNQRDGIGYVGDFQPIDTPPYLPFPLRHAFYIFVFLVPWIRYIVTASAKVVLYCFQGPLKKKEESNSLLPMIGSESF